MPKSVHALGRLIADLQPYLRDAHLALTSVSLRNDQCGQSIVLVLSPCRPPPVTVN